MSADVYYAREQAIREKEAQIRADERKRIIAKARMRAEGFDLCGYPDRRDAFNEFANELEAECE